MPASEHQPSPSYRPPPPPDDEAAGGVDGHIEIGAVANIGAPEQVGLLTARFVRYPGCQQLTLWLPQSGYQGYGELRVLLGNRTVVEQTTVAERLNGSVQILWDTLEWAAGAYRIEIDHDDGWRHVLALRKFAPGAEREPVALPATAVRTGLSIPATDVPNAQRVQAPQASAPKARPSSAPIVYRDGLGRLLPNVDLQMREQALSALKSRFSPHLRYEGNFRGGTITYVEGDLQLSFWHEMGGGGCKFFIDVPDVAHWVARTGTPLARRDAILQFIAETVQRDKASSWRFEIGDTAISFW